MMIPTPNKYFLVSGSAEGFLPLNAFDNALLKSGIGNVNLVKMSSIVPPACEKIEPVALPYGALVPVAYASKISQIPGEMITSAVACGIPKDDKLPGLIMEYSSSGHKEDIEAIVIKMVEEGFEARGFDLKEIFSISSCHSVQRTGASFAAVVLWY